MEQVCDIFESVLPTTKVVQQTKTRFMMFVFTMGDVYIFKISQNCCEPLKELGSLMYVMIDLNKAIF